ncbi:hypothetical protein TNCV_1018421 [Trichonephila clavipes]|nr:hypothetical protein TNCV_1018421 [Trichonephila clavipes]
MEVEIGGVVPSGNFAELNHTVTYENSAKDDKNKRKSDSQDSQTKRLKMKVTEGIPVKIDAEKLALKEAAEEKRLAILSMPKKDKRLYNKIMYGQKRKKREVRMLGNIECFE